VKDHLILSGSQVPNRRCAGERAASNHQSNEKVVAMKTLRFWFRPAILALFWVVLTAFTLAELATVAPVLRGERPRLRQARHAVQMTSARR